MTREKTLGIVIGLAVGLLIASSLVVLAYLMIFFIFPILFIFPLIGIAFGIKFANAGMVPQWHRPAIILAGVVFLALAIITPYALSAVELRWHGLHIPVPADTSNVKIRTGPFGSSIAGPSVTKVFNTEISGMDLKSFYRESLERDGWKKFRTSDDRTWFIKSGRHMFIDLTQYHAHTQVKATYNLDQVIAPWLVLVASVAGFFYMLYRYRVRRRIAP